MLQRLLFKRMDNSPLIVFRIFFGILVSCESFGAILTGWVRENLVEPKYTFPFIGFEWLQPLPGNGMYFYFCLMGCLGILIALGYRYRLAALSFALLWSGAYLMQKISYNNHYYLLLLVAYMMALFPAERAVSLDAKRNPKLRGNSMPQWVKWMVIGQLFLVYTYASLAKFYSGWWDLSFTQMVMLDKADYFLIGKLLQQPWAQRAITLVGILFDLLVVPGLLYKPTRKLFFALSLFFHLFNSVVFQIGIFPYLALAFTVFFFEPETIRKLFFKKKPAYTGEEVVLPPHKNLGMGLAGTYFLVQLLLPVRHWAITDDVLWTEEGHRMSWRMMLRSRQAKVSFKVVNKETGATYRIDPKEHLTRKQRTRMPAHPDMLWQFAQYLEREFAAKGEKVAVYAQDSQVSINGSHYHAFVDPRVDLAAEEWHHWGHHSWILPSPWSKAE